MTFLCLARAVTPRLTRGMTALLYAYGSIARTCCLSVACTSAVPRKWRLFLVVFLVRMWRLNACERLILPPARILKRLAALRLVFSLGIALLLFWHGGGRPQRSAFRPRHQLLLKPAPALERNLRFRFFLGFLLGFLFDRLLDFFLALLRGQDHDQLPSFHLRILLHHRMRLEILL